MEAVLLAIGFGWMTGCAFFVLGLSARFLGVVTRCVWVSRVLFLLLGPAFLVGFALIGEALLEYKGMNTPITYGIALLAAAVPICLCAHAVRQRTRTI